MNKNEKAICVVPLRSRSSSVSFLSLSISASSSWFLVSTSCSLLEYHTLVSNTTNPFTHVTAEH